LECLRVERRQHAAVTDLGRSKAGRTDPDRPLVLFERLRNIADTTFGRNLAISTD
jgi:hypothetical protein